MKRMAALLCLLALLASCGGKAEEESPAPSPEVSPAASAMASESPLPSPSPTGDPAESEPAEESPIPTSSGWGEPMDYPWGDTPPETEEERRMLAFQAVMERFMTEGLFPDGAPVDFSAEDRSQNQFTVWDVDGDGREELVVLLTTTRTQAGHAALIYDYSSNADELVLTLQTYPRLTFYSGGTVQAGWPADYSSGGSVMWPYTLFTYDRQTGEYQEAGSAKARTRALEGVKFPAEADLDGDGIVYCINMDYENPIDGEAYEAWRKGILGWEREVEVPFYPWTEENIAAIGDLVMDEERAKTLIEQANAALAPFLGEGAVECGQEGWLLLEGYSAQEELLEGLKGPFTNWLAEHFYESYAPLILKEEAGKVYVRSNSRDIIGHYYDMDLDTLEMDHEGASYRFSDYLFVANGEGNGTPVRWDIGINKVGIDLKINWMSCWDAREHTREKNESAVLFGDQFYTFWEKERPQGLGEPEKVEYTQWGWEEEPNEYRTEYYPDVTVTYNRYYGEEEFEAWYISVRRPGIPTPRGVEVGMTLKEVLAAYPQFSMWGIDSYFERENNLVYLRGDCQEQGEYHSSMMYFIFDANLILEEIYLWYDLSN